MYMLVSIPRALDNRAFPHAGMGGNRRFVCMADVLCRDLETGRNALLAFEIEDRLL